jgi:carboxypeptidase PM20D1
VGGEKGAVQIAALLKSRGVRAEYVLDEGGLIAEGKMLGIEKPIAAIGIAEKGYLTLELKVKTQGGHSSMPPQHTAIGILSKAIYNLEKKPFPSRLEGVTKKTLKYLSPELPLYERIAIANSWLFSGLIKSMLSKNNVTNAFLRTTIATTIIEAGTKENVLPQEARAVVNFRLLPGDSTDYVISRVKKIINDPRVSVGIIGTPREASKITDVKSKGFKELVRILGEMFPEVVPIPYLVVGGTDSRYYEQVSDCILRFNPQRAGQEDQKRVHGTDERVKVENLREFISFYNRMIRDSN